MLFSGDRIFIIEDNASNSSVMRMILEWQGARTTVERWVDENTIDRIKAFVPIDAIVLDLMFPDNITGYDIYEVIRSEPEFKTIPIVAVSAMDASVAVPKVKSMGFAGFIAKPIDYDLFPKQIASIVAGEQVWWLR